MTVTLENIGKKFGREWIFRGLSLTLAEGETCVILGGNGSGKSTLLQVISGFVTPNEGCVRFENNNLSLDRESWPAFVSLASPYLQLIEEFTASELVLHINAQRPFMVPAKEVLGIARLESAAAKPVRQFSSGMKQRLKLSIAMLSGAPLLLLDEPLSNLDKAGVLWYKEMVARYAARKTVVVCSNAIEDEFFFCERRVDVSDYKKQLNQPSFPAG